MSAPIGYRQAVPTDIAALLPLMRAMQDDDPWSTPFDELTVADTVRTLLENACAGLVWLITAGTQSIGYIVICFDYSLEYGGKGAWIDEFFVAREYRGQGLGAAVMRIAEEKARESGARCLHLEVSRGNPAIELYRRAGFEAHDRYLMTKWLG
jgi:GNAT superfamily N-acetyltransferase